jgi:hypothetical protein
MSAPSAVEEAIKVPRAAAGHIDIFESAPIHPHAGVERTVKVLAELISGGKMHGVGQRTVRT